MGFFICLLSASLALMHGMMATLEPARGGMWLQLAASATWLLSACVWFGNVLQVLREPKDV